MIKIMLAIFIYLALGCPINKSDTLRLMFWNVENFFAPGEFADHGWSKSRFYTKCNAVAKSILLAGDSYGGLPDLVGFAEVGDASVLKALLRSTPLRKLDYSYVHFDSPDRRGIDCALIYRRSRFHLLSSKPCHLRDSAGVIMRTRDILLAVFTVPTAGEELPPEGVRPSGSPHRLTTVPPLPCRGWHVPQGELLSGFTTLAVLINHHPSKVGPGSGERRRIAMQRLRFLADSLKAEGVSRIIAVGDFNDAVTPAAGVRQAAHSQAASSSPPGTIKFQGRWERIDGCPLLEGLSAEEHIFAPPQLLTRDSYGGEKPRRTFIGPRYEGGVSDHLPVIYLIL